VGGLIGLGVMGGEFHPPLHILVGGWVGAIPFGFLVGSFGW